MFQPFHPRFSDNSSCVSVEWTVLGQLQNNVYCIDDGEGGVIVVDPSTLPDAIMEVAGERQVSGIIITHRHFDHVGALAALKERTGAAVYASAIDAEDIEAGAPRSRFGVEPCVVDHKLEDGDNFQIGKVSFDVMLTPGHTEGGICYLVSSGTQAGPAALFSGDTLFCNSMGRTDFDGGSESDMRTSLRRLATLDDSVIVFPGHNEITSIGDERTRVLESY